MRVGKRWRGGRGNVIKNDERTKRAGCKNIELKRDWTQCCYIYVYSIYPRSG
jgi:hypothetical protein